MPPRPSSRRAVTRGPRGPRARPATKTRIRLDNEERRAQLLALARRIFSERSYDDVSIDDIARAANISKGLLYHYFSTKRDLYVENLREIAGELVKAVTSVPTDLPPIERVRAGIAAYLDHITRHAKAFVSLMRGGIGSDPEVGEIIDSVRRRMFDGFLEDSLFAPLLAGDPRFELSIHGWIGFVEAATIDWCANPRLAYPEFRELLIQVLFKILPSGAPPVLRT